MDTALQFVCGSDLGRLDNGSRHDGDKDEDNRTGVIGVEVNYALRLNPKLGECNARKVGIAESTGIFTQQAINDIKQSGCGSLLHNILLTEAYRLKHEMTYSQHVILSPADELASEHKVAEIQRMLQPNSQNKIVRVTLEDLYTAAQKAVRGPLRDHLDTFYDRYLDFRKITWLL